MAEQGESDLQFTQAEAGLAFKSEMWAMNVLLGYWKHILGVIAALLGSILIYGQYENATLRQQRGISADIARALEDLPGELVQLPAILESGIGDTTTESVNKVAKGLEDIASSESGPARVEALLKAAEIYRITGSTDNQRNVLELAAADASGTLAYAAKSALANLDLEQGNGDQAVSRLQQLRSESDGFLAEQATMDLALTLEHLGKVEEARATYTEFLTTWPDSPRTDEVQRRQSLLDGEDG